MGPAPTSLIVSNRSSTRPHDWSLKLANTIRSRLQSDVNSTGYQSSIAFSLSSTPSRATAWLVVHQSTWLSSATPWMTSQRGAIFGHHLRSSSWSLVIGRNGRVAEVSPSPRHSCGIYFLPTSDFSTTINFSERLLKLTTCNSPHHATEDLCHQCELYYYYYYINGRSSNYRPTGSVDRSARQLDHANQWRI